MRQENQQKRREQIEAAAYELLREKGYKSTSMLAVARRAGASNETLYRWYGNKQALFSAMVRRNAHDAAQLVATFREKGLTPLQTVAELGPVLLRIVTGEKAISLNRAAAGDVHETGTLGNLIAEGGKATIMPLLADVFEAAMADGSLAPGDSREAAEIYIALLIGDLQIERVINVRTPLSDAAIRKRADRADRLIRQLYRNGQDTSEASSS